jgi:restriction system protein
VSRRSSFLEDFFLLSTRIPFFAAVGISAALWALFDFLSKRWGVGPLQLGTFDRVGGGYLFLGTIAGVLRFAVPAIVLIGSAVGAFVAWRRRRLYAGAVEDPRSMLTGMSWQDFERLVADAFTRNGFTVQEKGGAQADGGVDLVLQRPVIGGTGATRYLIQCKQWKSKKVDVATCRELLGVVAASAADGGFVVSAGGFTRDAIALCAGRSIELVDNERLHLMMRSPVTLLPAVAGGSGGARVGTPTCPQCRSPMVKRVAKRGRGAGNSFWGCSKFPDCHGSRQLV